MKNNNLKLVETATKQETKTETNQQEPQDLMSLKELCLKHGYNYDYLYKYSILRGDITVYLRGTWKLSESEVLEFSRNMAVKKLDKIRTRKGGE